MSWRELRAIVPRAAVERVSASLFRLGAQGVQEDWLPGETPPPQQPWDTGPPPPLPSRQVLVAWFEDADEGAISAGLPSDVAAIEWVDVPDVDWETSWQQGFVPLQVTPSICIAPPWDAPEGALIIEPGEGFGTGHHPSTQGALQLMEPLYAQTRTCLDVGCGSGVLALAAAKHGLGAYGMDVEPAAIADAHRNAARNGLTARFDTTPLDQVTGRWDLVAANLHAELIVRLADDILRRTGGWLVCAGILADREHLVRQRLDPVLHLEERLDDGEWVALRYRVGPPR